MKKVLMLLFFTAMFCFGQYYQRVGGDIKGWEKKCNRGDIESCSTAAFIYHHGVEAKENQNKAAKYWAKSCDGGDGGDCESASGVFKQIKNHNEANEYYNKALQHYIKECNSGDDINYYGRYIISPCFKVGKMYEEGSEVWQDKTQANKYYSKAFQHLKKGCDSDSGGYCDVVGDMYRDGRGVEQNYTKAVKYYKESCERSCSEFNIEFDCGNEYSCLGLSGMYEEGKGVKQDKAQAKKYQKRGCDLFWESNSGAKGPIVPIPDGCDF
ncbi:MAG: sel1 repeat family protein [Campylobacteraceae bacterium]|jgi:TPR repeat protein|nr:sel1 repeat family protein [Campylobacteraceae bacterium]